MQDLSIRNSVTCEISVPVAQEGAFTCFVDDFSAWYPAVYSWSGPDLEKMEIEACVGGHCIEWGPGRFRLDWGTVQVFDRPDRLEFTWQIGPDRVPVPNPENVGSVRVEFFPMPSDGEAPQTLVRLTHSEFDRYGGDSDDYRDAMASEQGWPFILNLCRDYCLAQTRQEG